MRLPFLLLFLILLPGLALAAPPDLERLSSLHSIGLTSGGSPEALYAPRLLVWPQLERDGDLLVLKVPGEEERIIYTTEPLYTLGTIFGIAEGDWAVFTEVPAGAASPDPNRLVAIYIPRGGIFKWELAEPLDNRYAYAPRLFAFPSLDGLSFHWLALPSSGTASYGTITPKRNIGQLTVDGPRIVAKTVEPKNYRGSNDLVYLFYGLGKDTSGLPNLELVATRAFPKSVGKMSFDADEAFLHPHYTVLAGKNRTTGEPFVSASPSDAGTGTGLSGRLLGFNQGQLAYLNGADEIVICDVKLTGAGEKATVDFVARAKIPLSEASTLGRVVWVTSAWVAGHQAVLSLQVQFDGVNYTMDQMGTEVLAVWDWGLRKLVYQLAGQGIRQ